MALVTENPKTKLSTALADQGPLVALHVLRWAIDWSAGTIEDVLASLRGVPPADGAPDSADDAESLRTVALEAVLALDDALGRIDGLRACIPALTDAAIVGQPVADQLNRQIETLDALVDRTKVIRRDHEALRANEQRLRAEAADYDQLVTEVEELRRLEGLVASLPGVRAQHEDLSRRLVAMVAPAEAAERALVDTAQQIITLSTERQAHLRDRTRQVLADVSRVELAWEQEVRRHEAEKARLSAAVARYERLRDEQAPRVAALTEYARIDQELANQLIGSGAAGEAGAEPDSDAVRAALDSAQHALESVDAGLRRALAEHDRMLATVRGLIGWDATPVGSGTGDEGEPR